MVQGQSVQVEYDTRGNRIVREPWTSGGWGTKRAETLELQASNSMAVFPNPAQDQLNIQLEEGLDEAASLELINGIGELVQTHRLAEGQQRVELDLSGLPAGVFHVVLNRGDQRDAIRIIHQ